MNINIPTSNFEIKIIPKSKKDYHSIITLIKDYNYTISGNINLTEYKYDYYLILSDKHDEYNIDLTLYILNNDVLSKAKNIFDDLINMKMKKQTKIRFEKIDIKCNSIYGSKSINSLFDTSFFKKFKKRIFISSSILFFILNFLYVFLIKNYIDNNNDLNWIDPLILLLFSFIFVFIGIIASLYGSDGA